MSVFALLERLASYVEKEVNLVINSKQEAGILSSKLKKIQVGLQDAEKKGVTDANIKDWLKELEDVTYEADNVLDEWETVNLQVKVEGSQEFSDPWEKVRSLYTCLCSCFEHVVDRREITLNMRGLIERLDRILEERDRYNFVSSESDHSLEFKQQESTSIVDEIPVGRDDDKDSLVKKLVSNEKEDSEGTQIISIVGIGGVGKTTLAQLAYNDPELGGKFELKAWVSVSDPFDATAIARAILEAFGKSSTDIHGLETLVQHIRKFVENKRFLLVLDNVWTEDQMKWVSLKNCLRGEPRSRILVTTRSESVARMMGTSQWQPLGLLSDFDCGTILNGIALRGRTRYECEKLGEIGMVIAKKCNGLPLAARTVGSMLALRFTKLEWLDVLESPLWKYEDEISDLFRLLKLSYVDLSPLLKRCFLSCIVYPKGSLMHVDKLIRIWMAYGYLSLRGGAGEVHLKGLQYFQKLAMRSFFQKLESDGHDGGIIQYKMHDIMHDFANYLSGSEYSFIMDGRVEEGKKSLPFQRAHYNMLLNSRERIRTFCVRYISQEELPLHLVAHLKRVRMLIISKCNLEKLSKDVGKLIHLKYLDLSGNPIQELPETVSDLCNLQTLDLENCFKLSRLPEGIGKLINLRYLLNSDTHNLQLPQGLEKLTSLWTLTEFRANGTSKLAYLRNLNQLQGSLRIFIRKLGETTDELQELLKNKNQLQKLELFLDEWLTTDTVVALQPPPNLQTLATHGSMSKWLSNWIDKSFGNLKVLEFAGCEICSDLPPFGKLPALEKLLISDCGLQYLGMKFLVNEVAFSVDAKAKSKGMPWFPRLKKLHFQLCNSWVEWEDITEEAKVLDPTMPCLEELKITDCENLSSLPHTFLQQAKSLQFFEFSFCRRLEYRYYKGRPDWDKISHIPHVKSTAGSARNTAHQDFGIGTSKSPTASHHSYTPCHSLDNE